MFRKLFASRHRRLVSRRFCKLTLEPLEDRLIPTGYSLIDLGLLQVSAPLGSSDVINASGEVVANSSPAGSGQAFLYNNGQLTNLSLLLGAGSSAAYGINDSGQIVGVSQSGAFLFSNGQMTGLPLDAAVAINDSGQIAGRGIPPASSTGADQAALYSNGTVTYLGSFSRVTQFSIATGINASGQVVGFSDSSTFDNGGPNTENAFLYSNGKMTDLGTLPGDSNSIANGINASGQVVGESSPRSQYGGSDSHAFLYSNGQMTGLGTLPGDTYSVASGINSSGQVVGYSGSHAFLYSNGQMIDLNSLLPTGTTVTLTAALGINDKGQIVAESSGGHLYFLTQGNPPPPPISRTPPPPSSTSPPPPQNLTDNGVLQAINQSGVQLELLLALGIDAGQEFLSSADVLFDPSNPDNPTYLLPSFYKQLAAQNSSDAFALYQDFGQWMYWAYLGTWTASLDMTFGKGINPEVASSLITNIQYYAQQIQQNPLSGTFGGINLMGAEAQSLGADYIFQQTVFLLKAADSGDEGALFSLVPINPV